ncbi:MAG: thiamine-phosphate kinase [Bacteroidia bacterium]|nr:thiamine-phosphate kinase [Bacteroidia bacterium]
MTTKKTNRTEIGTLGEFGLIDHLVSSFSTKNPSTLTGVGDDAAVLDHGDAMTLISTDMLIEGIHFDLSYTPLKHLGYKSIVVNVSDIYAMNGTPEQVTVSIGLSNRFSVEAVEELYAGIKKACLNYGVDLIGGDTSASNKGLIISVTAIGRAKKEKIVYRNGAKVGDLLCISGNLGAAFLGLQILEREKQIWQSNPDIQPDFDNQDYLIGRQLKPEARFDMIELFAKHQLIPTSMIDISDGLASDLFHICKQSNVGAFLEESGVSVHPDTEQQAIKFGMDPITCALSGGEDYELLFTINPNDFEKVKYLPDVYIAGEIINEDQGVMLHTKGGNIHPITAQGWQHFNKGKGPK